MIITGAYAIQTKAIIVNIQGNPIAFTMKPLSAGPNAKPRQNATSAIAYTLPYTDECLISTKFPIVGIIDESTMPMEKPSPKLGIMRP